MPELAVPGDGLCGLESKRTGQRPSFVFLLGTVVAVETCISLYNVPLSGLGLGYILALPIPSGYLVDLSLYWNFVLGFDFVP